MSIRWKFILWGLFFYMACAFILYQLLDINKWYFVAGEIVLLISLALFIVLFHQLVKPIDTLSSAVSSLKEKDFSTRLSPVKQKEINQLVDVYNKMSEQLHHERVEHEEKNLFLSLLIDASPSAILVLNGNRFIDKLNPSARKLFKLDEHLNGPFSFDQLPIPWLEKFEAIEPGQSMAIRIDGVRQFKLSCGSFMDKGFSRPFILIEEMTRELIRAERHSYEKVIRMMSHEVNNSVGAVNSVLQSILALSEQFDENLRSDISHAIRVSMDRNKSLNQFMSNFADVVKLPSPQIKEVELASVIDKTLSLFESELATRKIKLHTNLKKMIVRCDPVQLEQVFVNILKNSMEAIDNNGNIYVALLDKPCLISIKDDGPGFSKETTDKLFTPFYSSKKTGQGIGLILAREVLLNHEFAFKLHRINGEFTEFLIELG